MKAQIGVGVSIRRGREGVGARIKSSVDRRKHIGRALCAKARREGAGRRKREGVCVDMRKCMDKAQAREVV